VPILYRNWSI